MCVAVAGAVRVEGAAAMRTFLVNGLFLHSSRAWLMQHGKSALDSRASQLGSAPSSVVDQPSQKRTISDEDRAAMKRMRARYTPKFFRSSDVRGSIRSHGAAVMEKIYSGLSEEAFRENGNLRETGDACPERDCKSDLSDSDDEPPMCLDGPDDA